MGAVWNCIELEWVKSISIWIFGYERKNAPVADKLPATGGIYIFRESIGKSSAAAER